MSDELTAFLEKRQEQILDERTDEYGRFISSKDESFYYGYLECMQDIYYFFEDKERNIE